MKTTAAAFCAAILATSAQAQQFSTYFSGQELYRRLTGTDTQVVMAYGYIAGVNDSRAGATICIPPATVTLGQMADMVKQTLERVPSERHLSAEIFVEATLSNRWPCARKGSSL
jgi:hypothetical protein